MHLSLPRLGRWLVGGLATLVVLLAATPARAQIDIAGEWNPRLHEDQPHRVPGAELGDYTGLPINDAVRQKANHWDASILSLPEQMAKPHAAQYFMRGPGPAMRVTKVMNPATQALMAYTIEGVFGRDDRVIWMDGRPHPSENAEYTWDGFSTGKVEGNQLTVTTTHMKYGVIQRNGVASSTHGVMTEHFIRHNQWLELVTIIDDPDYLEEPFIRTSHWVLTSNITPDQRFLFEVVDEIADRPRGKVPNYPFGTVPTEFATKFGIPLEAAMGGKITIYPEYEQRLRQLVAAAQGQAAPAAPAAPARRGGR